MDFGMGDKLFSLWQGRTFAIKTTSTVGAIRPTVWWLPGTEEQVIEIKNVWKFLQSPYTPSRFCAWV